MLNYVLKEKHKIRLKLGIKADVFKKHNLWYGKGGRVSGYLSFATV